METTSATGSELGGAAKRITQRTFVIVENRLQLLLIEMQEERERILCAIWLALAAGACGLLAGVAFTVIIAVALWDRSPILALLVLALLYLAAAVFMYRLLVHLQRNWQSLPSTLEQLKKDRECLEKNLI